MSNTREADVRFIRGADVSTTRAPDVSSTLEAEQQASEYAGLLLALTLYPTPWVHRRVETCEFLDDRTVRRWVSLDFTVPARLDFTVQERVEEENEENEENQEIGLPGDGLRALPLALVGKGPLRNFDIHDEEGRAVPIFSAAQVGPVATAALLGRANVVLRHPPAKSVQDDLRAIAERTGSELDGARERLGLAPIAQDAPCGAAGEGGRALTQDELDDAQTLMSDTFTEKLVRSLADNFLLLAQVDAEIGRRRILKFSFEEQIPDELGNPIRSLGIRLGWVKMRVSLSCPGARGSRSFHIEVAAPPGLEITDSWLRFMSSDGSEGDAAPEGEGGALTRAHLHRADVPAALTPVASIYMRMQRSGFLLPALMACLLTPTLLLAGSYYLEALAREVEATATVLLLGPGLLAVYLARPAEHGFATRLLGGVRFMLLLSAFCAIAAGAILLADVEAADREIWWRTLTLLSAAAALAVAIAYVLPRRKPYWKMPR